MSAKKQLFFTKEEGRRKKEEGRGKKSVGCSAHLQEPIAHPLFNSKPNSKSVSVSVSKAIRRKAIRRKARPSGGCANAEDRAPITCALIRQYATNRKSSSSVDIWVC